MNIPNPYFSNVPEIGNLSLDYVFAGQDCPIIFTCRDTKGNLYFCICVCMTKTQIWLLTKVSSERMVQYINNRISNNEMFLESKNKIFVLEWQPGMDTENCEITNSQDIEDDRLPPKKVYLDAYENEFDDYISVLFNREAFNKQFLYNELLKSNPIKQGHFSLEYCKSFQEFPEEKGENVIAKNLSEFLAMKKQSFFNRTLSWESKFTNSNQKNDGIIQLLNAS